MTAEELVALRKSLGLTQSEMAELMGMKTRAFQEIENGRSPVREIHRLAAERGALHLAAERGEPIGRKFDFLCQEFNREANTLCSKSADIELTRIGIDLKGAVERMREQVQNVE